MSLKEKMEQERKSEHNAGGGGYFKFKEGVNKIRVLSEPEIFYSDFNRGICYTDCGYQGTPKGLSYVIDYTDNQIKLMRIPYTITEYIAALETHEDYAFHGYPMPFDLIIEAKDAGTKEVDYKITPRPVRSDVPAEVLEQLSKKKLVSDVIQLWKDKKKEEDMASGAFQKEQERKLKLKEDLEFSKSQGSSPAYDYPESKGEPLL